MLSSLVCRVFPCSSQLITGVSSDWLTSQWTGLGHRLQVLNQNLNLQDLPVQMFQTEPTAGRFHTDLKKIQLSCHNLQHKHSGPVCVIICVLWQQVVTTHLLGPEDEGQGEEEEEEEELQENKSKSQWTVTKAAECMMSCCGSGGGVYCCCCCCCCTFSSNSLICLFCASIHSSSSLFLCPTQQSQHNNHKQYYYNSKTPRSA